MDDPTRAPYSILVAQAAGMVSVQADCNLVAAIDLMQRVACDTDTTLEEIAALVVDREVRFDT